MDGIGAAEMPPGGRRFAANAAALVAAQAVGKVASFAFVIIVTRGLGTLAYGYFNFAVSFVPIFLILGTWGLDTAIVRSVVADRNRVSELVASGLLVRVGLSTVAFGLAAAVGPLLVTTPTAYSVLLVVGIALLVDEVTRLIGMVFNLFERSALLALVLLVNRVASALLALAAVAAGADITLVSVTYLLGSLGALALAAVFLRRRFPPMHLRDAKRTVVAELMRMGAALGVAGALNMALFRVDAVLLQLMRGTVAVAMYGVAYRFLDSFLFVVFGVGAVLMPRVARLGREGGSERPFNLVLAVTLAFYTPVAVGSLFTATWVVETLFSERFTDAADAVKWLTGAGVFYAVAYLARISAVALGARRQIAQIAGLALVFNLVGNVVAIPRFGFTGAAAVTFASEVLEAALLLVVFARTSGGLRLHRVTLVPLLATAAMAIVLALVGRADGVAVVAGAAAYAVALPAVALLVAPHEVRRLRTALGVV